jgi:hypothetical protein
MKTKTAPAKKDTVERAAAVARVPRPDVFAAPLAARCRPAAAVAASNPVPPARPGWIFMAAHGGSGAGLLAELSQAEVVSHQHPEAVSDGTWPARHGVDGGQCWPNPSLEPTRAVVLVGRTTAAGLAWIRDLSAQYMSGAVPPGLALLGVVLIADQPGRPPPQLAAAERLIIGGLHQAWRIPYIPTYRLWSGLPGHTPPLHPAVETVLTSIREML